MSKGTFRNVDAKTLRDVIAEGIADEYLDIERAGDIADMIMERIAIVDEENLLDSFSPAAE